MSRIPLITSLPPRLSRFGTDGENIGAAYQQKCIDSWYAAGFEPISVNSVNEDYPHLVRLIPVHRDASALTGRPHIYFDDMLAVAAEAAKDRTFVITNADIFFEPNSFLPDPVISLRPGEFIFSRRIDITDPTCANGTPYHQGFDFFAAHADDLSGLSTGMVFGAPWWDHFFPLIMHMRGCHIRQAELAVLHLKHEERCDFTVWETLGHCFLMEMMGRSTGEAYRLRLQMAIEAAGETSHLLRYVANANLSFLDEIS